MLHKKAPARIEANGALRKVQVSWRAASASLATAIRGPCQPGDARLGVAAGRLPNLETNADAWPGNIGTGYLREVRNHRQGIAFRPKRAGDPDVDLACP